jgi:hypothetical protein
MPDRFRDPLAALLAILALALFAAAPAARAAEAASVDWPALASALERYLAAPSDATAGGVTALLPSKEAIALPTDPETNAVRERIFRKLGPVDAALREGKPGAAGVAFALRKTSDGEFTRLLDEALGAALATRALDVLRGMQARPEVVLGGCRFASALPAGMSIADEMRELEKRRDAVKAVADPAYKRERVCALLELDGAL